MCACVKREERNAMPMLRAETGRYTQRAMQASPYVATAGVIAGGGAAGINFLTSVPEKLGEGLQAAEEGIGEAVEAAMALPGKVASGISGVSGGQLEFVAFTVVALGAGFVLIHYVTN